LADLTPLERGIAALKKFLGADASDFLQPAPLRTDEAASFYFPLPEDYTGEARRLRIGFPSTFPLRTLRLHVEPSPWLVWPHATEKGLCLHGFRERPVTGSPEVVVKDSLSRLVDILLLSNMGSCQETRDAEFRNEITSYWSRQHDTSLQNVILLDRPKRASRLFAVSDPRQRKPSGQETVWLGTDASKIKKHYSRAVGRSASVRAPQDAGFYVKLDTYPSIRFPAPKDLSAWLSPHLLEKDLEDLKTWFDQKLALSNLWIALELPGANGAPIYCLNLRTEGLERERGSKYGLRSARKSKLQVRAQIPAVVQRATLDLLDRETIFSRDVNGTANQFENYRVVCVGVGSLGAAVALHLARSGIGHLTLIDPDTLSSANLGRHVLGADDLGRLKAVALKERICKDLPTVDVHAKTTFAEVVMSESPDIFQRADLVVVTTADWESEVALWTAKSEGTPWRLLQAWSEPHALVGHALLAPAGAYDARDLFNESGEFRHKYTNWSQGGVIPLPACGEAFIPGSGSGMTTIASMVSQVALRSLAASIEGATWHSSIYRPQEASAMDGQYCGPDLPPGTQSTVLERAWPAAGELAQ